MKHDQFGDCIKAYEDVNRVCLDTQQPIILRLDGSHFHTYVKGAQKPFDPNIIQVMDETAKAVCKAIHGSQIAYTQSDEISILINSYRNTNTSCIFNGNIQKIVSVSAGIASATFSHLSPQIFGSYKAASFDARVFNVPVEEVNNVFLWRQQDCVRNSISSLAHTLFSPKELHKKNSLDMKNMLLEAGKSWDELDHSLKMGRCIIKETYLKEVEESDKSEALTVERTRWTVDLQIPNFQSDPYYIQQYTEKDPINE